LRKVAEVRLTIAVYGMGFVIGYKRNFQPIRAEMGAETQL